MDQFSFHSRKILLEAVRSAEDAAIQLRQYAAATLPPVWEIPEISGDAGFPVSIEITAEGWLRMELPCVMPRRKDNDRSRFLAGLLRNAIHRAFPKHDQPRFYTCVNPRSRLIHFSKNSSFHYFTVDEMGLRLMKLALDEMALYRFQRYLQQNGICKASMLPLYLFSLELLSEAYALKKGKQMRAELDRGALFSCQADVVKRICNTGPNLITIPDKWLLDLDTERDDSSDELLLSPNATFLSQQSGM